MRGRSCLSGRSRIQAAIAGPSRARVPAPGRGGTGVKDFRQRSSTLMMSCLVGADGAWWMDSPGHAVAWSLLIGADTSWGPDART
jgi:hypothetical protein